MNKLNLSDRSIEVAARILPRYKITAEKNSDEALAVSYLGTPIYSNLEFLKVSGTSLDNSLNVGAANGNSKTMLRIDTVIFSVNREKIIQRTEIQGRSGTVKEYISNGDYMISISGEIVSPYPNVYPHEEVGLLIELLNLEKPIPIASSFLQMFSISEMVVDRFHIDEKLGSRNEVPFQIEAWSDQPIEFKLNA